MTADVPDVPRRPPTSAASPADIQLQPFLHDLVSLVSAPALALSPIDGDMRGDGAHGFYVADRRIVATLALTVDGHRGVPLAHESSGSSAARFVSVLRHLGDRSADPTVILTRTRTITSAILTESFTVTSNARTPVELGLVLTVGTDLVDISVVKRGATGPSVPALQTRDGMTFSGHNSPTVDVRFAPSPSVPATPDGRVGWNARLTTGQSFTVMATISVEHDPRPATVVAPVSRDVLAPLRVEAADRRLVALVEHSAADLRGLLLGDPSDPADTFLAAGSPWFLTLFGRDSLIAARMLLPLGVELAGGTLRALARRQGTRHEVQSAEAPGKILHEMRSTFVDHGGIDRPLALPPIYYGSVDATPLWIVLLHDAWRWGLPDEEVIALLPALHAALGWLHDSALHHSGFVAYVDESGTGIVNQGWKDSWNSIQFNDGSLATAPIALCDVQAYAFEAARCAAALLDAFPASTDGAADAGRLTAAHWLRWADGLGDRVRASFWIDDRAGAYPAVALDGRGRRVDTVTSNIAHMLGIGLLTPDEEERVVARLRRPDMDCGWGLRTMSSNAGGFNPFSYHGGSVWSHDTALAILGLNRVSSPAARDTATSLINGLLEASTRFGHRLPELFVVENGPTPSGPIAYPASCRPQAWSAAVAIAILTALVGVSASTPSRALRLNAQATGPFGAISVSGLQPAP